MMPILRLGPLAIQLPGLLGLAGIWLGSLTLDAEANRRDLPADSLSKVVFFALVVGLVSARLGYVLRYAAAYAADPAGLLSLSPQSLSLPEGVVGALLFAWIYGRRAGLPLGSTADALTPMLAVFAVFLALAHLASGSAFGAPSDAPWAIELWGASRHPSQVYELVAGLVILGVVLLLRVRALPAGSLLLDFAAMSAAARLFLEAFRGDSVLLPGGIRAAQLASLMVLVTAMVGIHLRAVASGAVEQVDAHESLADD